MYQVITWDPADTARPVVVRTEGLREVCGLLYAAGRSKQDVTVEEYTYTTDDGVGFLPIFDSTET